jgi:AraC-like DNA-binding protein
MSTSNAKWMGKRSIAGIGRIIVWPGGSLWIGRQTGRVQDHAHHAIQISLAIEGEFRIQADGWRDWVRTSGSIVPPDLRHRFDGCGSTVATLFMEPTSTLGAALLARYDPRDVSLLTDLEVATAIARLRDRYLAHEPDALLTQAARAVMCRLAGNPATAAPPDPRITAALAWMRPRLGSPIRLGEVAAAVHLSPGRFRHLFVTQTGTSLRAWLLWARVDQAVGAAFHGSSWTDAAQDAGFSDAAHLSRTCRRIFGISPTMLVPEHNA